MSAPYQALEASGGADYVVAVTSGRLARSVIVQVSDSRITATSKPLLQIILKRNEINIYQIYVINR